MAADEHVLACFEGAGDRLGRSRLDGVRNSWPAVVADLEPDRDRIRVRLSGSVPIVAEVTPGAVAELDLVPGAEVWASVKAVDLVAYER